MFLKGKECPHLLGRLCQESDCSVCQIYSDWLGKLERRSNVIAIVPCLNEEKNIAKVVASARKYVDTVIVSDGGSLDKTREIAAGAGACVLYGSSDATYGYGANIRVAMVAALRMSPDIIVLLDGDGQHNPMEIPLLLKPIQEGYAGAVMGSRKGREGMPLYRRIGAGFLTRLYNLGAKVKSPDAVIGFWAIKSECLPPLSERKWGICIEMLVKMRARKIRLASVPITPFYHSSYEDNSTVGALKLGWLLAWYIIKWRILCEVIKI